MLTRKLAKQLFMPLIYGKTIRAMANDIRGAFGSLLSYKDYYSIADLSYEFWTKKYPDISNLMKLINLIGWFCSSLGKPVYYSTPYLTTVQDYMRSEKADIWVYDRANKKRRRVTLRVPTQNRDKRKTQVSTCVNFIHQKDAYIAMAVVKKLMTIKKMPPAPIYTVHENFVTTPIFESMVPQVYIEVFMALGHPIFIISSFIRMNLCPPKRSKGDAPLNLFNDTNQNILTCDEIKIPLISITLSHLL